MYTPNNAQIFTAAYSGAIAGMGVSDRVPSNSLPVSYAGLAAVAGAFAEEFDTLWALAPAASLQIQTVQSACEAAWQDRAPQPSPATLAPPTHASLCRAIIAVIKAGEAFYLTNGIPNPAFGGGGGPSVAFPARVDCSVNSAYVEGPYSSAPILHGRSAGHVAGGYNGGGIGNKPILGFRVGHHLPLGSLVSFQYTWEDLNPVTPGFLVYANLVCDINGDGSKYKILVVDPASVPILNNGTTVTNLDGSKTTTFLAASMNVLVVLGLNIPPDPPAAGGFVMPDEPPALIPPYGLPGGWPGVSYKISTILANYPAARLAEAASGDGGLPKSPNTTPAFMLITGDSTNQLERAFRLTNIQFNGIPLS